MSHLLCAITLGTQLKHQYDTYFGKIHGVAHEILSVLYFSLSLVTAETAILKKSYINSNQLHLQIILTERDYILFSIL